MSEHCPTCGQPVRVVSTDEGTSHYEAAAGYGLVERRKIEAALNVRWLVALRKIVNKPHATLDDLRLAVTDIGNDLTPEESDALATLESGAP